MRRLLEYSLGVAALFSALWMLLGIIDYIQWGARRLSPIFADPANALASPLWQLGLMPVMAFMEYPEKRMLSLCAAAGASVLAISQPARSRMSRFGHKIVLGLALVIALFSLTSKGLVSFYSADSDIAQWHHLCVAVALLLLVITLRRLTRDDSLNQT